MSLAPPLVSVCLPVYNGERHVEHAIASILDQSYRDLELIISDNASTDRTGDICRAAAARDGRVKYVSADVNCGLAGNFNRAFAFAKGRYLMWLGHDDVIAPAFVARCVEALDSESDTVLCFTNVNHIDDDGRLIAQVKPINTGASAEPGARFARILWEPKCDPICGLKIGRASCRERV